MEVNEDLGMLAIELVGAAWILPEFLEIFAALSCVHSKTFIDGNCITVIQWHPNDLYLAKSA